MRRKASPHKTKTKITVIIIIIIAIMTRINKQIESRKKRQSIQ